MLMFDLWCCWLWRGFATAAEAALVVEPTKPYGASALPMTKYPAWSHLPLQTYTPAHPERAPTARAETHQMIAPTRAKSNITSRKHH